MKLKTFANETQQYVTLDLDQAGLFDVDCMQEIEQACVKDATCVIRPLLMPNKKTVRSIRYDVSGLKSLEDLCTEGLSTKQLIELLNQVKQFMQWLACLESGMQRCMFDPAWVYIDIKHFRLQFLILPIRCLAFDADAQKSFLRFFLKALQSYDNRQNKGFENVRSASNNFALWQLEQQFDSICTKPFSQALDELANCLQQEQTRTVWTMVHEGDGFKYSITEDSMQIGRAADNHICLQACPSVSRYHALLELDKGRLFITDLHSSNGSFLNKARLEPETRYELSDKSILTFGKETFLLESQTLHEPELI